MPNAKDLKIANLCQFIWDECVLHEFTSADVLIVAAHLAANIYDEEKPPGVDSSAEFAAAFGETILDAIHEIEKLRANSGR